MPPANNKNEQGIKVALNNHAFMEESNRLNIASNSDVLVEGIPGPEEKKKKYY